ncbi:MAG: hypothetical protein MJ252_27640 [archaeon]|nr:hypothetical protein [archaeon]
MYASFLIKTYYMSIENNYDLLSASVDGLTEDTLDIFLKLLSSDCQPLVYMILSILQHISFIDNGELKIVSKENYLQNFFKAFIKYKDDVALVYHFIYLLKNLVHLRKEIKGYFLNLNVLELLHVIYVNFKTDFEIVKVILFALAKFIITDQPLPDYIQKYKVTYDILSTSIGYSDYDILCPALRTLQKLSLIPQCTFDIITEQIHKKIFEVYLKRNSLPLEEENKKDILRLVSKTVGNICYTSNAVTTNILVQDEIFKIFSEGIKDNDINTKKNFIWAFGNVCLGSRVNSEIAFDTNVVYILFDEAKDLLEKCINYFYNSDAQNRVNALVGEGENEEQNEEQIYFEEVRNCYKESIYSICNALEMADPIKTINLTNYSNSALLYFLYNGLTFFGNEDQVIYNSLSVLFKICNIHEGTIPELEQEINPQNIQHGDGENIEMTFDDGNQFTGRIEMAIDPLEQLNRYGIMQIIQQLKHSRNANIRDIANDFYQQFYEDNTNEDIVNENNDD